MSENGLPKERLTWMFTQMVRIREFEERVKSTFEERVGELTRADEVHGLVHLSPRSKTRTDPEGAMAIAARAVLGR